MEHLANTDSDVSALIHQFAAPVPALYTIQWCAFAEVLLFNEEIAILPEEPREWICDQEVNAEFQKPSLDMFADLKEQVNSWDRNATLETEISNTLLESCKKHFKSTEDCEAKVIAFQPHSKQQIEAGYALMTVYLHGKHDFSSALMLFKEDRYVIVSCSGEYPHVQTPEFGYSNSDASSPGVDMIAGGSSIPSKYEENLPRVSTAQEIFENITSYFQRFCADEHHF
jgi:hypothetical protein